MHHSLRIGAITACRGASSGLGRPRRPRVHLPRAYQPLRSLRLSEGDEDNVVWEIEAHSEAGVDVASVKIGEVPKGFERRSREVRLTLKRDRDYLVQVDVGAHDYARFTLEYMAPGRMYWGRDSSGSPSEWRADRAKVC